MITILIILILVEGCGGGGSLEPTVDPDFDKDGILNKQDNCPTASNNYQEDRDTDGVGDVCDNCPDIATDRQSLDWDHDGLGVECDNCVGHYNPDQADDNQDGRGNECNIDHVVIIDIDGLRPDVLYPYLNTRSLADGGLAEITNKGKIMVDQTNTVFPSVTYPAQASLFTGVYPSKHGITGNEWFDRTKKETRSYSSASIDTPNDALRVYGFEACSWVPPVCTDDDYLDGIANRDLMAPTIFQYARDAGKTSGVIFAPFWKGLTLYQESFGPTVYEAWDYWYNDAWESYDTAAAQAALDYLDYIGTPNILTLYLPGLDHKSHLNGIATQTSNLKWYDEDFIWDLVEHYKNSSDYANTVWIVVSDHGQRNVQKDDAYSLTLDEIQKVVEVDPYDDMYNTNINEGDFDSFAGFNSGMLQIYLSHGGFDGGWSAALDFEQDIVPVLNSIWKNRKPGGVFNVSGVDAIAEVLVKHGSGLYLVVKPYSGTSPGTWCEIRGGYSLCPITASDYEGLPGGDNVDSVRRRFTGLMHTRSGDIILLPESQFYFNDPTIGIHGSLNWQDSNISFLIAGEPLTGNYWSPGGTRSIVDVAPTIADLLGFYRGREDKFDFDGKSVLPQNFFLVP